MQIEFKKLKFQSSDKFICTTDVIIYNLLIRGIFHQPQIPNPKLNHTECEPHTRTRKTDQFNLPSSQF